MIDIFIGVLLAWAAFSGWRAGLIKELFSAAGFLVGLFVAATCYSAFGKYLSVDGTSTNMVTSVIAFFLLWIVVPIVLGLVANVLTKVVRGLCLGLPNAVLGAVVSVTKYVVLMSCVFNVMNSLHIMNEDRARDSHLYGPVTAALRVFFPADSTSTAPDGTAGPDTVWVDMKRPAAPAAGADGGGQR